MIEFIESTSFHKPFCIRSRTKGGSVKLEIEELMELKERLDDFFANVWPARLADRESMDKHMKEIRKRKEQNSKSDS